MDDALNVVVDTPVAPVMAPVEEMSMDGVDRKLVYPVAEEKFIPFITLVPLFVAAGKFTPFSMLVLFGFEALERDMLIPFTVVVVTPVFEFVKL